MRILHDEVRLPLLIALLPALYALLPGVLVFSEAGDEDEIMKATDVIYYFLM